MGLSGVGLRRVFLARLERGAVPFAALATEGVEGVEDGLVCASTGMGEGRGGGMGAPFGWTVSDAVESTRGRPGAR